MWFTSIGVIVLLWAHEIAFGFKPIQCYADLISAEIMSDACGEGGARVAPELCTYSDGWILRVELGWDSQDRTFDAAKGRVRMEAPDGSALVFARTTR